MSDTSLDEAAIDSLWTQLNNASALCRALDTEFRLEVTEFPQEKMGEYIVTVIEALAERLRIWRDKP